MDKNMRIAILLVAWLTLVIVGLAIYLPQQSEKHSKNLGKTCIDRISRLYAPHKEDNEQSAYGIFDFKTAYAGELDAKAQCILQYPQTY